jgi:hypothetical protein
MHLANIPWEVGAVGALAMGAAAAWRGGPTERRFAAVQLTFVLDPDFAFWRAPLAWHGAPADVIVLAAGLTCVIRGRSYWTIWACAVAVLNIVSDIIYAVVPGVSLWAYLSAELVYSYAMTLIVLWGSITHRKGSTRAWRLRSLRPLFSPSRG